MYIYDQVLLLLFLAKSTYTAQLLLLNQKECTKGGSFTFSSHVLSLLLASGQYSIRSWPLGGRNVLENQVRCGSKCVSHPGGAPLKEQRSWGWVLANGAFYFTLLVSTNSFLSMLKYIRHNHFKMQFFDMYRDFNVLKGCPT